MTKKAKLSALVVVILALAMFPAAVLIAHHPAVCLSVGLGMLGLVTVTYPSFQTGNGLGGGYLGGTTAPTPAQSYTQQAMAVAVSFADGDTSATITHNFGVSAAQLAALMPYIQWYCQQLTTPATGTYAILTFALTNSNVITVSKTSNVGTGGTYVVIVRRPWSASE